MSSELITREMTIDEIFSKFPSRAQKLARCLTRAGLNCVGCSAATWETLEGGVLRHGKDEDMLLNLLNDLNAILQEELDGSTVTLTSKAANKFKEACKEHGKEGYGLRFDEIPAGCSGFEYVLEFSEKALPTDCIIVSEGVEIHIDENVKSRLIGSEIDFVDDGLRAGFEISNKNSKSSCGCGNSHGYN